jgi:hypothetical protein
MAGHYDSGQTTLFSAFDRIAIDQTETRRNHTKPALFAGFFGGIKTEVQHKTFLRYYGEQHGSCP